jgi:hypothetical protein
VKLTPHLHLTPRSKNGWSYTSTPQYAFIAWCSVKAQGRLYLYVTKLLAYLNISVMSPKLRVTYTALSLKWREAAKFSHSAGTKGRSETREPFGGGRGDPLGEAGRASIVQNLLVAPSVAPRFAL